jgi:hypothetical protein
MMPVAQKNPQYKMLLEAEGQTDSNLFSTRRQRRLSSLYYESGFAEGHQGMYGHK